MILQKAEVPRRTERARSLRYTFCAAALFMATACDNARDPSKVVRDSTTAVLENASVPVVDGNTRRGQLRADSLYILADGASLAAFEVQLVLAAGRDSLLVQAAEARMRVGSGAVDLERFRFTTRGGRQVSADRGTFDGENSIRMTLPVRIDGSPKEATGAALTYRVDTGELAGCRSGCE